MPALHHPGADEPAPSIATRRKEFVAREIEEAAIRLFHDKGYENVTVADISEAIGISRRTFFRYFASKEHILRAHATRLHARVIRALERRPPDEPAAQALCNAFLDTAEVSADERESMLRRNRVLREHQGQAGWETMSPEVAATLTDLVAARMGVDPTTDVGPRLVVATIWAAADAAAAFWAANPDDEPLTATLRNALTGVTKGLATLDP